MSSSNYIFSSSRCQLQSDLEVFPALIYYISSVSIHANIYFLKDLEIIHIQTDFYEFASQICHLCASTESVFLEEEMGREVNDNDADNKVELSRFRS